MNRIPLLLIALLLTACEKAIPFESAEELLANPDRFKELQRQCRDDWDKLGNAQCNAVTEAERKRFMGKGADSTTLGHSAHDHLDTRSMLTWTPDPRPLGQAVGAQRRRFALLV